MIDSRGSRARGPQGLGISPRAFSNARVEGPPFFEVFLRFPGASGPPFWRGPVARAGSRPHSGISSSLARSPSSLRSCRSAPRVLTSFQAASPFPPPSFPSPSLLFSLLSPSIFAARLSQVPLEIVFQLETDLRLGRRPNRGRGPTRATRRRVARARVPLF